MGRRSKDPGSIPHLRKRKRGKTVYYFFDHGGKPRRETPLGKSYPEAVRKWAELMATEAQVPEIVTFKDAATRYAQLVIPKKRASTAKVNLAELAKLEEFFCNPPAPLARSGRCTFASTWTGERSTERWPRSAQTAKRPC